MQPSTPHHDALAGPDDARRELPVLDLPPVPFGGPASPELPGVGDPSQPRAQLPVGTSVQDLLGALAIDGMEPAPYVPDEPTPSQLLEQLPAGPADAPARPLHEFSIAVDRRGRGERRSSHRPTPDRRAFASEHLAAPDQGPVDPRPTEPPTWGAQRRSVPIDPVMPPLPIDEQLQPVAPYRLPNRGIAASTQRSTRASLATSAAPFPSSEPVIAASAAAPTPAPAPMAAPAPTFESAPAQAVLQPLESVFAGSAPMPVPVGHLQPREAAPAAAPSIALPDAGPAGPAMAPGAGLDPVTAAVATAPSAWYGGAVQVDDSMLVWNAPGTQAPLAPQVAASIAAPPAPTADRPVAVVPSGSAVGSSVATTPLAPTPAATRRSTTPLRLALLVGIPAASGIGLALAIDRFLL
jgi:hypothetical protein